MKSNVQYSPLLPGRFFGIICLALAMSVGLVACAEQPADDDLGADTMATDTMDMDDGMMAETVDVALVNFEIQMPDTLQAGRTTFVVTNDGNVEHSFDMEGQGTEVALESPLQPGASDTISADLQSGSYTAYCPVGDHRAQGMETQVYVEADTMQTGTTAM